ncbi:MAG: 4Fe-4S cluster-binding domain-containing protein [Kofleriaceae bacterium]|nr:4Fe-4S cluster-binding domain-containing protein [Kofleriaceae bacterium]
MSPEYTKCQYYTRNDIDSIPQLAKLSASELIEMKAVSAVLPFRVNRYVVEELIDWEQIPNDPMYQLVFPQPGMLEAADLASMVEVIRANAPSDVVKASARKIQDRLNPHPAGQTTHNVPIHRGQPLPGIQHKYRETVLFFPSQGQTCHAYCTYCFRWAQFAGIDDLKFAARESETLVEYLRDHPEVTSVLITGGDPMVMNTRVLKRYIEPILEAGLENLESIRIGTKAVAYWPQRFVSDKDSDELIALFSRIVDSGIHLAIMGHYSHPKELSTAVAKQAVRRIQSTGAVIRSQAPLIRQVNDSAETWRALWRAQIRLGIVPYYMFVERDTGPKKYFEVPLVRALTIFNEAYSSVSGLGRSVRGPSMSATPGKVLVDAVTEIIGQKVIVLKMLQARDPSMVGQIAFARYNPDASWLGDLEPAFGNEPLFGDSSAHPAARHHLVVLANQSAQQSEYPS